MGAHEELQVLFDFFEGLDELICVSEMDSGETLFLNRSLRERMGLTGPEDYRGKPGAALFHDWQESCTVCNGADLMPGQIQTEICKDPVRRETLQVKTRSLRWQDRELRVVVAAVVGKEKKLGVSCCYDRSEYILNGCLQRLFAAADPDSALELTMAYLGETFHCDRVDIFEIGEDHQTSNTYEWCREGVVSRRGVLQDLPPADIAYWEEIFKSQNTAVISDVEELRQKYPNTYSLLKPQGVRTMVAGAIRDGSVLRGLLSVHNMPQEFDSTLVPIFNVLGYFAAAQLKRRDLYRRLNELSYRDMLTGAYNRNALYTHSSGFQSMRNLGVLFCDISGLKNINDTCGHHQGDEAIRQCFHTMQEHLNTQWIYRTGGDEFVAIYPNVGAATLREEEEHLRQAVQKGPQHVAIGSSWSNQKPLDLEALFARADQRMYQDKEAYYTSNWIVGGRDRRHTQQNTPESDQKLLRRTTGDSPLDRFLSATYHDFGAFLTSLAQDNDSSYFFFGDVEKDIYYISDNMRDNFGFDSNVVPGLPRVWMERICNAQDRERYHKEMERIFQKKEKIHDLRYQVRNAAGQAVWIRCYGTVEWDEQEEVPLFFSGRLTQQNERFVIDPVTNFPKEPVMLQQLKYLEPENCRVLGFCLNNIYEINATRGRAYADHLIHSIAEEMVQKLSGKMSFFRLDGMRCAALVSSACGDSVEMLIGEIREIIQKHYAGHGIKVCYPCAFAYMEYMPERDTPADFVADMVSLIRVARHEPDSTYVDAAGGNLWQIEERSNISLGLSRDVMGGMRNFRIVVQPLVDGKDGKLIGGEVLLRWHLGDREIPPAVFIPILEQENLILSVGRWVMDQAARICVRMLSYDPTLYLSVNISRRQLADAGLSDFIRETLEKYQLDGHHLVVEMTESCMDGQQEKLQSFTEVCRQYGIQVALDDFGSGYSSFRVLMQGPCSIIKLNQSLLWEIEGSEEKKDFVFSVVYACHRFGKQVCMEGVETAEQEEIAREAECDILQGFYYYRPMEVDQIYQLLSQRDNAGEEETERGTAPEQEDEHGEICDGSGFGHDV